MDLLWVWGWESDQGARTGQEQARYFACLPDCCVIATRILIIIKYHQYKSPSPQLDLHPGHSHSFLLPLPMPTAILSLSTLRVRWVECVRLRVARGWYVLLDVFMRDFRWESVYLYSVLSYLQVEWLVERRLVGSVLQVGTVEWLVDG